METPTFAAAVAAEVRASLGRAGITQGSLADRTGFSRATLSRKLAGKQTFTTDELMAIAPVLDVRASELLARAEAEMAGAA